MDKENQIFCCDFCGKNLSSKQRLESHKVSKHQHVDSGQIHRCHICGNQLRTKRNLDRHRRLLHERSPLKGVYKQYRSDPEVSIPDRTLRRLNALASKEFESSPRTDTSSTFSQTEENAHISTSSDLLPLDKLDDCSSDSVDIHLQEKYTDYESNSEVDSQTAIFCENNEYLSVSNAFKESENGTESENDSSFDSHNLQVEYSSDLGSFQVNDHELLSNDESDIASTDTVSDCSKDDLDSSPSFSDDPSSTASDLESDNCDSSEVKAEPEATELCFQAYVKHYNLSNEATKHLMELISVFSPEARVNQPAPQKDIKCVHYCDKCNEIFPDDRDIFHCASCNNLRYVGPITDQNKMHRQPRGSFVIADIHDQLGNLLEKPGIWASIQHMKQHINSNTDGNIHDIVNGEAYKNLCCAGQFLNNSNNISAIINTDGIPLYSSSKVKLWPVFISINEIPPARRFSRDNILLAGMWQGKGNPPFKQYISSLAEELNKIYTDGISISTPENDKIDVKLCVLCGTFDLQAKGYVANMTMHNGEYGCSTCEESGLVVKKGRGHVRSYPYKKETDKPPKRIATAVEADGLMASRNQRLKGICGVSGLSSLLGFDLVDGLVPDYMHGLLLGVTKSLMTRWFSASNAGRDFFIGNRLKEISGRLIGMTPPDSIERLPRDLEQHYSHFKATEYQVWLLFYCIPCTKGILPDKYLEHFGLLAESAFLLLGDNITSQDLQTAEHLLSTFYEKCGELYGPEICGLNIHNAGAHLADFVRLWGPIWSWSCFPFEDMNAKILKSVHGTGDVTQQAVNTKQYDMQQNKLSAEASSTLENKKARQFLQKLSGCKNKWTTAKQLPSCKTAGKLVQLTEAECSEDILLSTGSVSANDLRKCYRVELNDEKYFSQKYHRMKARVCHFAICDQGEVAAIQFFVVNSLNEVFAVVKLYEIPEDCHLFRFSGRHIFKIKPSDCMKTINVLQIKHKLVYMSVDNEEYVARMPNILGKSVFK